MQRSNINNVIILFSIAIAFTVGYLWGYTTLQTKQEHTDVSTVRILFVGDMMFDRTIRAHALVGGYDRILEGVKTLTQQADIAVGNLEGPITREASRSMGTAPGHPFNFTFTFAPEVADTLAQAGFDAVSLANNHSTDFGREGIEKTIMWLEGAGVSTFGNPFDVHDVSTFHIHDMDITLIGYNDFGAPVLAQTHERIRESNADIVVVMAHWGEEYSPDPSLRQQTLARQFVDAGADVIVGAHPHVVQTREIYNGVPIYYSLGNFVFDQYWREDVRCGLMLEVEFTKRDGQVMMSTSTHTTSYLERDGTTTLAPCMINS